MTTTKVITKTFPLDSNADGYIFIPFEGAEKFCAKFQSTPIIQGEARVPLNDNLDSPESRMQRFLTIDRANVAIKIKELTLSYGSKTLTVTAEPSGPRALAAELSDGLVELAPRYLKDPVTGKVEDIITFDLVSKF